MVGRKVAYVCGGMTKPGTVVDQVKSDVGLLYRVEFDDKTETDIGLVPAERAGERERGRGGD